MKNVYIDSSLITAFLLDSHEHNKESKELIIRCLLEKDTYYLSAVSQYITVLDLLRSKKLQFSDRSHHEELDIEIQIINSIEEITKKIKLNLITTFSKELFIKAQGLMESYQIPFNVAFHGAVMIENKIKTIATVNDEFLVLINEGLINKY